MTLHAPERCPNCGYDPTGDDVEFRSGGGWGHDHSVAGSDWIETLSCPTCGETVASKRQTFLEAGGGEP